MNQRHPHDATLVGEDFSLEAVVERLSVWHREHRCHDRDSAAALAAVRARSDAEIKALESLMVGDEDRQRLASLSRWLKESLERLTPVLQSRGDHRLPYSWACDHPHSRLVGEGRVLMANAIDRDLAGPGAQTALDPGGDLASLLVGLEIRGETRLARRALDQYLRESGDYGMPPLLSIFRVIEALAGARRALRRRQEAVGDDEQPALLAETMGACRRYLTLAEQHAEFRFPPLVIGVGVTGSGKSRFTRTLVGQLGAVRLCSDAERRRLHEGYPQASQSEPPVDIFSDEATERTYRRLADCAGRLLDAGFPVCIDATCLKREQRNRLRHQAESRGLPVLLVSFEADEATLEQRIRKRASRRGGNARDGLAVLHRQRAGFEGFTSDERLHLIHLDTTADNAGETLAGLIQEHAHWT
ncbi:AAA family ATPase [Halomonas nitroreducens]|uniref:ATP-binding protein n=1 Tax=Halomonas nitroreducens TaxID=447425 RepID=A0A3S0K4W0_9GAMM|nr:bifunctional aminoglycoside phosphotransferase/ATP-binding protein [Halomonas nitroreducens]RTR05653.1 ATP-binding protein [Halomonas nitroreducens]